MQRAVKIMDESLVSLSAAARELGINKSTLSRQVRKGMIRTWGGRVRISEVKADREANLRPRFGGLPYRGVSQNGE
jgi:hypothetical protein